MNKLQTKQWYVLVIFLMLLSACAAPLPPGAPDAKPTDASNSTNAADPTAFPVTIAHKYGSTTVTQPPQRIVTVGLTEQDALLALGITPVGTTEWFGGYPGAIWPWAQDKLGETLPEVVGDSQGVNFEKIASLQPDLILALYGGLTQEQYDLLSQIAPVVAQPAAYVDYGIPWQELTRQVGLAVGKAAAAEQLVNDVEARFAQSRETYPAFTGATALVVTPYEGVWVYGREDARGRLLTTLGFTLPDELDTITGERFGSNLSLERLDFLDVDALLWIGWPEQDPADGVRSMALYQNLAVYQEGREVLVNEGDVLGGATSFITILSLPYLLDTLVPMLAAAVDGDPATAVVEPSGDATAVVTAGASGDCEAGFRLFDHALLATDPVCIPAAPERVIALDMASVEATLLAGKTLVATSGWILSELPLLEPRFAERLQGVEDVGYPANLEKILLLKPDLILAVGGTSAGDTIDAEQAQQIATLVFADPVIYNDWKLGMKIWSDVLNATALYEEMLANYQTRVAELRTALGDDIGREISVLSTSTYGQSIWMPDTPPGAILADVGLARPASQRFVGEAAQAEYTMAQYVTISDERLDLADGDDIFFFTYAASDPATADKESASLQAFTAKPVWQSLQAVKAGRAHLVPEYWWRSQTYLLANKVIDDLFAKLTDTTATTAVLAVQE